MTGLVVPTVIVMVVLYVNIQDGNLCVLINVVIPKFTHTIEVDLVSCHELNVGYKRSS